jgi:hypothetical protein
MYVLSVRNFQPTDIFFPRITSSGHGWERKVYIDSSKLSSS